MTLSVEVRELTAAGGLLVVLVGLLLVRDAVRWFRGRGYLAVAPRPLLAAPDEVAETVVARLRWGNHATWSDERGCLVVDWDEVEHEWSVTFGLSGVEQVRATGLDDVRTIVYRWLAARSS